MTGPGDHWATPPPIIAAVRRFWPGGVDLDPCSNEQSIVGARVAYEGPDGSDADGLTAPWAELATRGDFPILTTGDGSPVLSAPVLCYMNPPFSAPAGWYKRIREQAMTGLLDGIGMCPVATSTRWWQDHVWRAAAVCFLFQRPAFLNLEGKPTSGNRYDCAMPYYGPEVWRFRQVFAELGEVRT